MTHSLRAMRFIGALIIGGAFTLTGCGPSTAHLAISDADVALAAARGARAETYAVFEYTCATEHLRKAREEEGYSDFDAAVRLARKAREFAVKAKARALGRPAAQAAPVRVVPVAPVTVPAQPASTEPTAVPAPIRVILPGDAQ